jgi:hypothetical protein
MQSRTLTKILKSHPLATMMAIEALLRYSAMVAESKPEDYPARGLINPESWIQLGKDIQQQLNP